MTFAVFIDGVTFTFYRISSHALLNGMDDPALLAMVFC
jgi:hypothetical protein